MAAPTEPRGASPDIPFRVTLLLMLVCFTGFNAIRLNLSLLALELGANTVGVSLLYASFYFFPMVLSWPIGSYSDRLGRGGC